MKVLTDLINRGHVVLMDDGDVFPVSPLIGQFALVAGVLYIYSSVDGFSAWRPLTRQIEHYKHTQVTSAIQWTVDHNLESDDLIVGVYDEDNTVTFPANIEFTSLNRIILDFTVAIKGKALVFSMSDSVSVGANFKYYTDTVYNIGTKSEAFTIDITNGSVQNVTMAGAGACSFTGFPTNSRSAGVVVDITNGKDNITFPGVKWSGGIVPTLSVGLDRLFFTSGDAGTTIYGFTSGLDMK